MRDYNDYGNVYDSKIYYTQYDDEYYSEKVKKYNKTLIADSGYDSSLIKQKLNDDNIKPIIKYNKRNCKNENIIEQNRFDSDTFKLYKTRFIIEKTNGSIKNIRRVQTRYDRKIEYFKCSLFYAYMTHLIKNIMTEIKYY